MHFRFLNHNCLQQFKIKLILLFIAFNNYLLPSNVNSQVLEPRSYSNIPVGMNFLIAAYG